MRTVSSCSGGVGLLTCTIVESFLRLLCVVGLVCVEPCICVEKNTYVGLLCPVEPPKSESVAIQYSAMTEPGRPSR